MSWKLKQNRNQKNRGKLLMSYFLVDVEADGPIPGQDDYSMVCFGAILFDKERKFDTTFYGETAPISKNWDPEALAISGFSREMHQTFEEPKLVMEKFKTWVLINSKGRPIFLADNNGFDFMYMHWYFEHFFGKRQDPFGWSSRNLTDIYHGITGDMYSSIRPLRKATHDHNPVSDSLGNAQAFATMVDAMGLKI